MTGEAGVIRGIDFRSERSWYIKAANTRQYYFDGRYDMYRDFVSDFVYRLNAVTDGAVVRRLERIYDLILIDEMQDLVGYDLDVLDSLLQSAITVMAVGDPRQHTYSTHKNAKYKKYRGAGIVAWIEGRSHCCELEVWTANYRCNQDICDFADSMFPDMPVSQSMVDKSTGHDGIHTINKSEVDDYVAEYQPTILRYSRAFNTGRHPAMNIGVSKGSTFDRVLIFPTKTMLAFLGDRDVAKLKSPEHFYVAVTRARYSVTFVTD